MLTATYTLVAFSVEQASMRLAVRALQAQLQAAMRERDTLAAAQSGQIVALLQRSYASWHRRQLDLFLVPAIRSATDSADQLLFELDELSRAAGNIISTLADRAAVVHYGVAAVARFAADIDAVCAAMLSRFDREERELFPVAQSVIGGQAWFAIANRMLVHDAQRKEAQATQRRPDVRPRAQTPPRARVQAGGPASLLPPTPPMASMQRVQELAAAL